MRQTVLLGLVLGLGAGAGTRTPLSAQDRPPLVLTLPRCEALALEHNVLVTRAGAELDLSRARRTQAANARFVPRLNLRNVVGPIPRARGVFTPTGVLTSPDTSTGLSDLRLFTQVDLNVVQPLFTFGHLRSLRDAATFGVEAGEANVAAREAEVRAQVRELYWGLVLGRELLDVVEDAIDRVDDAARTLEEKLDEGSDEVTQNDVFKLTLFRYEIDKRHREALDKVALGTEALRAAIGLPPGTVFSIDTTLLDPVNFVVDSLDVYLAMAREARPELAQLRAGLQARSALVRASRSQYLPQLFLGAQITYNRAADRFDSRNPFVYNPTNFFRPGVVLGFEWNLNVVQTRDRVRVARLEQEALAGQESALADGIALEVRKAWLAVRQADANIRESRRALRASENWLRAEAQTMDLGVGDVKEFIDAFRANSTMKAEHLENIFRFNTAVSNLSRAVGRDLYPA